ncbi:hypothetical protein GJ496_007209 [Pomphorhynchus laevis]|nr:hypothetical protein GJ496_007209 [Pomphorhynchus laevis]
MQYRSNHLEFIIANQNLAINLCQIIKSIALLRPPINRSSHVTLINRKTVKIALEYDISLKGYLTLERKHTDFHSMEKIEKKSETDEMASHYETDFKFYYIGKKMNKLISYMNPIISANDIAEYLPERIRKKIMVKSRKQDNEVSSFPDYNRDSLTYKGGSTIQTKRSTWCGNNIDNIEKTDLNRRSLRKSQSLNNFDQLYESQNRMRGFSKNNQDSQSSDSAIKF